jgi:hypothetical protein
MTPFSLDLAAICLPRRNSNEGGCSSLLAPCSLLLAPNKQRKTVRYRETTDGWIFSFALVRVLRYFVIAVTELAMHCHCPLRSIQVSTQA